MENFKRVHNEEGINCGFNNVHAYVNCCNYDFIFFVFQEITEKISMLAAEYNLLLYRILFVFLLTCTDIGITDYLEKHYSSMITVPVVPPTLPYYNDASLIVCNVPLAMDCYVFHSDHLFTLMFLTTYIVQNCICYSFIFIVNITNINGTCIYLAPHYRLKHTQKNFHV